MMISRSRVPRYTAFGGTRHERSWGSPGAIHSCLDTARCARHSVEREDGHFRSGSPCPIIPSARPNASCIEGPGRSEEHTSELQSLMRIWYAVFCLKKKK